MTVVVAPAAGVRRFFGHLGMTGSDVTHVSWTVQTGTMTIGGLCHGTQGT